MSGAFSSSTTRAPSSAKRRAIAQPTTPAPTTITSKGAVDRAMTVPCHRFLREGRHESHMGCPFSQFEPLKECRFRSFSIGSMLTRSLRHD
jgi:hypothetical protein